MTTQTQSQSTFFDLHVNGIGYLNRVRMVKPKKGQPFVACTIAALRGEYNKEGNVKPESTKFDLRVAGKNVEPILELLSKSNSDPKAEQPKVMVTFRASDIYAETFVHEKDMGSFRKGDVGVSIKGRLLKITRAWIDNTEVDLSAYIPNQSDDDAAANSAEEKQSELPKVANA